MPELAREPDGVDGGRFILLTISYLLNNEHKQGITHTFHHHLITWLLFTQVCKKFSG